MKATEHLSALLHAQKQTLWELEAELASVLDQQALVEGQLADPDVYADHARSSDLLKTFESCKQRSEAIFEEMTTLEEGMTAVREKWNVEQD